MVVDTLATVADLQQIPSISLVDENAAMVEWALAAASSAIRDAADNWISHAESTITLDSTGGTRLILPSPPVLSLSSVQVDGVAATGWRLLQGSLWRRDGWGCSRSPVTVTVTYTHGYDPVPDDIRLLCAEFAAAAINSADDGLEVKARLAYEGVDDYRVGYQQGADQLAGVVEIPDLTRERLRARFGRMSHVVGEWE